MRAPRQLILMAAAALVVGVGLSLAGSAASAEMDALKIAKGKVTFRIYCSNCHGDGGRGDGNLAELLSVPPANLTIIAARNGGRFPTMQVRALVDGRETVRGHGLKEMPVWGDAFQKSLQPTWTEETDEERAERKIEEVVAYLESIQGEATPAAD